MADIVIMGLILVVFGGGGYLGFLSSLKKKARENAQKFYAPDLYGTGSGFADDRACRKGGLIRGFNKPRFLSRKR